MFGDLSRFGDLLNTMCRADVATNNFCWGKLLSLKAAMLLLKIEQLTWERCARVYSSLCLVISFDMHVKLSHIIIIYRLLPLLRPGNMCKACRVTSSWFRPCCSTWMTKTDWTLLVTCRPWRIERLVYASSPTKFKGERLEVLAMDLSPLAFSNLPSRTNPTHRSLHGSQERENLLFANVWSPACSTCNSFTLVE